jgi:hypothetical protein
MADFTQTVTNSLNVLAASPGSLWGTFQWNETWGQDEDLWTDTNKAVSINLVVENILSKSFEFTITNTLSLSADVSELTRSIGIWDYVFTKPSTDGDEAVYDESSKVADASTEWSDVTEASSTWSDA